MAGASNDHIVLQLGISKLYNNNLTELIPLRFFAAKFGRVNGSPQSHVNAKAQQERHFTSGLKYSLISY